ncbi:MAG TPA: hypothetical protein VNF07_08165 [Acidimicrobiales bacterium]|nr:hypothetical protein [Acidimicrobiales bacterium]
MADQEQLLEAIGARLLEQIGLGATSDTVLKLAEAWAWVHSPAAAHGARASD